MAGVIVPPQQFPYNTKDLPSYDDVFPDTASGRAKAAEFDKAVLHDAVLNVAMVWRHVWNQAVPKPKKAKPA